MTLEGALDFHKNLARWNGIESDKLVKAKKNDFTKNTPKEEGIQAFSSKTKEINVHGKEKSLIF